MGSRGNPEDTLLVGTNADINLPFYGKKTMQSEQELWVFYHPEHPEVVIASVDQQGHGEFFSVDTPADLSGNISLTVNNKPVNFKLKDVERVINTNYHGTVTQGTNTVTITNDFWHTFEVDADTLKSGKRLHITLAPEDKSQTGIVALYFGRAMKDLDGQPTVRERSELKGNRQVIDAVKTDANYAVRLFRQTAEPGTKYQLDLDFVDNLVKVDAIGDTEASVIFKEGQQEVLVAIKPENDFSYRQQKFTVYVNPERQSRVRFDLAVGFIGKRADGYAEKPFVLFTDGLSQVKKKSASFGSYGKMVSLVPWKKGQGRLVKITLDEPAEKDLVFELKINQTRPKW
jgi:hypothetical protein